MTFIIPIPEKVSLNVFYSQRHWAIRKKIADSFHEAVFYSVKEQRAKPVKNYPVFINYTFYMTGRLLDATNTPTKLVEDGLVKAGILQNDSPKYVKGYAVLGVHKSKENVVVVEIT